MVQGLQVVADFFSLRPKGRKEIQEQKQTSENQSRMFYFKLLSHPKHGRSKAKAVQRPKKTFKAKNKTCMAKKVNCQPTTFHGRIHWKCWERCWWIWGEVAELQQEIKDLELFLQMRWCGAETTTAIHCWLTCRSIALSGNQASQWKLENLKMISR